MPKSSISVPKVLPIPANPVKEIRLEDRLNAIGSALARAFQGLTYTPILVLALIIAAYFIGSLRTEVIYLKKLQGGSFTAASTQGQGQANAQGNSSAASPSPAPLASVPPFSLTDHVRGNRNAPILLIEYSDFECPFCKSFQPTLQQAFKDYDGKVAWVYRHFPLEFHANAQKEAEASECITELGGEEKFWQFADTIFERTKSNGTGFALDQLKPLAQELGVDGDQFQACLDSGKYEKLVKDDQAGGAAAGVDGTPGTFIVKANGTTKLVPGAIPLAQLKQQIDATLK